MTTTFMGHEDIDVELGTVLSREESIAKRKKDGFCPTCFNKLYDFKKSRFRLISKKIPLTMSGKVFEGRCLYCHPIVTKTRRRDKRRGGISELKPNIMQCLSEIKDGLLKSPQNDEQSENHAPKKVHASKHVQFSASTICDQQKDQDRKLTSVVSAQSSTHPSLISKRIGSSSSLMMPTRVRESQSSLIMKNIAELSIQLNSKKEEEIHNDSKSSVFHDSLLSDISSRIPGIIKEMFSNSFSAQNLKANCETLVNLAVNDDAKLEIIVNDGLIILKEVTEGEFISDVALQEKACEVFNRLIPVATEADLEDLSIVENIINIMNKHLNSLRVQENAVGVLWKLSTRGKNYKSMIAKYDGISTVLFAMNMHSLSVNVQKNGCAFLCNMSAEPVIRKYTCQSGGCNILIAAMKAHQSEEHVQLYGCATLLNLSADIENRDIVENSGALQTLINAMNFHVESQDIQRCGHMALSFLLGDRT